MSETRREWLTIIGAPLIALGLLGLLRLFLPPGMALAVAMTSGMAWGYYWKTGRPDLAVVPVAIAGPFAVAQPFPEQWRWVVGLAFLVAGYPIFLWLRQRHVRQAADR